MGDINLAGATTSAASGGASGGLAGAALGAGINVGGQFLTSLFGARMERERYQRALAQWERENAYNLPKNQVARLRAAGLNPALMNGGAPALAASSPEPQQSPVQSFPAVDPLTAAQIGLITAQTKNIEGDTARTDEERKQLILSNFFKQFQVDFLNNNKEMIEQSARQAVATDLMSSTQQYYEAAYSAAILASIFGYDKESEYQVGDGDPISFYKIGNMSYDGSLAKKFKELGLSRMEQQRLEYELYESYQHAQKLINKQAGEEAKMDTVVPEMINSCPKWLRPILIFAWQFVRTSKMPSFSIGHQSTETTTTKHTYEHSD